MALTKIRAEQISDIDFKQAVRVVATTNVTLTNGAVDTIDSVLLVASDRVLVTAQSTASQNGLYRVSVLGTGANGTWVRSSDGDATGDMSAGMLVTVTEGTVYANTQWQLTTDNPIVLATTSLVFAQISSGGSYTAGTGLTLTGSAFSVNVAQTQITSVGTLTALSVSGTVTGASVVGGVITGSSSSVTGIVTGASVVGGVITGTSVSVSGNVTAGNVSATGLAGTLSTAAQGSITSVGTLTALAVTGNVTAGNVSATGLAGTLSTAAQGSITSVGTLTALAVTGNVTAGNVSATGLAGTLSTAAQGSITSVGTLTALAVTGNVTAGNVQGTLHSGTTVSVTGVITGASVVGGVITGTTVSTTGNVTGGNVIQGTTRVYKWTTGTTAPTYPVAGDEWYNSSTDVLYKYIDDSVGSQWVDQSFPTSFGNITVAGTANITGNVTGGNLLTGGLISAAGNITGGNVIGGANVNATTHTGTTVSVTGNITSGASVNTTNLSLSGNVLGNLLPSANITFNLGSPTQRWNTLYLAANTIDLGSQTISATETGISMGTGNLTGGNVITTGLVSGGMVVTTTTTFASNTTIATSGMVVGPMTINTGVTVTLNTGVRWVIF